MFSKQNHRVLISSPLLPSQQKRDTNRSREQKTQLCLQIELAEEKSQSLHLQKSLWWAQQRYFTKEKTVNLNGMKKNLCMQARNVLTNFSPNPARP